jgi:hypothetical protein
MNWIAAATAGFAAVDADPALKQRAARELDLWQTCPGFAEYRPQLEWMVDTGRWAELLDCFCRSCHSALADGAAR